MSPEIDSPKSTVHRAIKQLQLRPYRIQTVHQLLDPDKEKRLEYCHRFRRFVREGINVMDSVFFTDEAWFHLDGYVNSQNSRIWSAENPHAYHEKQLHPQKIGVWCAISRKKIIGPIFFDYTVNAERYQNILLQFIALLEEEDRYCWLQHDGATSHYAHSTSDFINEFFGDRVIGQGLWPPRSPDLTAADFFLWGYLKEKSYSNKPRTLEQLKFNIAQAVLNIQPQTLKTVARNVLKRVEACIREDGGHFQHLI